MVAGGVNVEAIVSTLIGITVNRARFHFIYGVDGTYSQPGSVYAERLRLLGIPL